MWPSTTMLCSHRWDIADTWESVAIEGVSPFGAADIPKQALAFEAV